MIRYLLIINLLFFIIQCNSDKKEKYTNFNKFPNVEEIKAKVISKDIELLNPYTMAFNNGRLLITELRVDYPVRIYNVESQKFRKLNITKGRGPNQVIGVGYAVSIAKHFEAFDAGTQDIYRIWPFDAHRDNKLLGKRNLRELTEKFVLLKRFDVTPDGMYYFIGNFNNGRFLELNTSKGTVRKLGKITSEDVSDAVYNSAHEGYIVANENLERIAIGQLYSDVLEIYNMAGNLLAYVKGPMGVDLKYVKRNEKIAGYKDDNYACFKELFNYDGKIYAMFSGTHFSNKNHFEANKILVYNWNGKPIKKYLLDRRLLVTALDKEHGYLYGVSAAPEIELVRYELGE